MQIERQHFAGIATFQMALYVQRKCHAHFCFLYVCIDKNVCGLPFCLSVKLYHMSLPDNFTPFSSS